jgi:hypothetical protein
VFGLGLSPDDLLRDFSVASDVHVAEKREQSLAKGLATKAA